MIGVQILAEWLATFIEVVFYFSIIHVLAPEQFKRKKQMMMFLVITSIITAGVILLNFIDLSFSLQRLFILLLQWRLAPVSCFRGTLSVSFLYSWFMLQG